MTISTTAIEARPGLFFTCDCAGPTGSDLVMLLHGFPESRHIWGKTIPALAAAGYRAIAPDQRGYSAGARPDPTQLSNYAYDELIADVLAIADLDAGPKFHLVAHDWAGSVAWGLADRHSHRLSSLTVVSRPHPQAFRKALLDEDGDQRHRSRHHQEFLEVDMADRFWADDARMFRRMLSEMNVSDEAIAKHMTVIDSREALEAALAWYRANNVRPEVGPTKVPTLFIWGDADQTVGPKAAFATKDFVAAPFRMEVIPGVGHFALDEAPDRVTRLVLDHLNAYR